MRERLIALAEKHGTHMLRGDDDWYEFYIEDLEAFSAALSSATPAGGGLTDEQILACLDEREPVRTHHGAAVYEYRLFALIDFARRVLAASQVPMSDTGAQEVRCNHFPGQTSCEWCRPAQQIEHETSDDCWCQPEAEYVDPDTGATVWVHRGKQ